jgi:hypothetical protein
MHQTNIDRIHVTEKTVKSPRYFDVLHPSSFTVFKYHI